MTDTKQPEALRLAEQLNCNFEYFLAHVAAELRRQHAEIEALRAKLDELAKQEPVEIDWPDYHSQGMGCGLEDRGIRDRYEAMRHGWDQAIERVAECLPEKLYLAAGARPVGEVPAGEYPPLPEVYATMHDDGHWTMKAGKEPYESYYAGWRKTVYTADQMWRYVDADRAMRATQPAPAAQDDAKDAAITQQKGGM